MKNRPEEGEEILNVSVTDSYHEEVSTVGRSATHRHARKNQRPRGRSPTECLEGEEGGPGGRVEGTPVSICFRLLIPHPNIFGLSQRPVETDCISHVASESCFQKAREIRFNVAARI